MSSLEKDELEGCEYEVFLNFRGKDTRNNFTDVLFCFLDQLGIRTFLDDNELRHGDQIGPTLFEGIKKSKIFVPIFSTNYAESKWCLRELTLRVEYNKENIRPFFYDVEPSHVKNQSGFYDKAFKAHGNDKSLNKATIEEWRNALTFVGNIKGWQVPNIENGRHGAIAKKFASEVFRELNKFSSPEVTEYFVGFESQVMDVMNLLDLIAENVLIIGICGIGGIGKTTLAKVIYKQIWKDFDHHCFLGDVVDNSKRRGIEDLQKHMISNLLGIKDSEVGDADKVIKKRFRNKKVLILLDDVDNSEKINKLIKSQKCFGKGSRIIVTTRNKEIIGQYEGCRIYEVKQLDGSSSLELFNKHAFGCGSPSEKFVNLSIEIVSLLGGLPLAIKLVGSRLWKRSILIWKETLRRLKLSPSEKLPESLRISYDQLAEQEKEIFLDIACLFIGCDKAIVTYFWESCDLTPEYSIDVLTNLSLVKIDGRNKLHMHDLLRDLGQDIARKEGKRNGTYSRLWSSNEVLSVLEGSNMGTEFVKALHIDLQTWDHPLASATLKKFPRLIYLGLERSAYLSQDFKDVLLELRWLRCQGNRGLRISNFFPKNLIILDLPNNNIVDVNFMVSELLQEARNLKVLNLERCWTVKKSPVFPENSTLEVLILKGCHYLAEMDPSIWYLKFLVHLDLSYCFKLKKFPEPVGSGGGLASLTELNLKHSSIERLSNFIGHLKNLEVLNLRGADGISELPVSVCGLQKLEVIDAFGCLHLGGDIPRDIGSLSNLRILDLTKTRICSLPQSIGTLGCLQELHIHTNMIQLQVHELVLPSSLTTLSSSLMLLNKILNLSMLKNLQKLMVNGNYMEECFRNTLVFSKQRSLSISGRINRPPTLGSEVYFLKEEIESLSHLSDLRISSAENLRCLPKLPSSLKKLLVWECSEMENLGDFSTLRNLLEVDIFLCPELRHMEGLQGLALLRKLSIRDCEKLQIIYGLEQLPSVKVLTIEKCMSLRSLPNLSKFANLSKSSIDNLRKSICSKWIRQPIFESLVFLDLSMKTIESWELSEILQEVHNLKVLDLSHHRFLKRSPVFPKSSTLERLILKSCKELVEIDPSIWYLKCLVYLDLSDCSNLKTFPEAIESRGGLESLTELNLESSGFEMLPDSIGHLKNLEALNLRGCRISEFPVSVYGLQKLNVINVSRCFHLGGDIQGDIGSLSHLRVLDLTETKICSLPDSIGTLGWLQELHVHAIHLQAVPELPSSLTTLSISPMLLNKILNFSVLKKLKKLVVDSNYVTECQEISGDFKELSKLETLSFLGRIYKLPTRLGSLSQLVTLNMESLQVHFLTEEIGSLSHLSKLRISSAENLQCLPKLPSSLKELVIWQCFKLENLGDLSTLKNLLEIDVFMCPELIYMEGLQGLELLWKLSICDCGKLQIIYGLEQLPSVQFLKIEKCTALISLPNLSKFINLSKSKRGKLRKSICSKWIGQPISESLVTLDLSHKAIERWELSEILQEAHNLKVLDLSYCWNLTKGPLFPENSILERLILQCCKDLVEIDPSIWHLKFLVDLDLSYCSSLKTFPKPVGPRGGLESLTKLNLKRSGIGMIPDSIGHLTNMKIPNLSRCGILKLPASVKGLQTVPYVPYFPHREKDQGTSNSQEIKRPCSEEEQGRGDSQEIKWTHFDLSWALPNFSDCYIDDFNDVYSDDEW